MNYYKKGEKAEFTKRCEICGDKIETKFILCGRCYNLVKQMEIEYSDMGDEM